MHTLIRYMRPYWRQMLVVLGAILLIVGAGLAGPWLIRATIGLIAETGSQDDGALIWISAGLATVYLGRSLGAAGAFYFGHVVAFEVCRDLRDAVHVRLQTFSPSYFDDRQSGDLVARVVKDTLALEPMIADVIDEFLGSFFLACGIMVVLLSLSPALTIMVLAPLPAGIWLVWRIGRRIQGAFRVAANDEGKLAALVQDQVGGMRDIQLFNREASETTRFRAQSQDLARKQIAARRHALGFEPTVEGAIGLSTGTAVLVGDAW